jgi:hypothetical protein
MKIFTVLAISMMFATVSQAGSFIIDDFISPAGGQEITSVPGSTGVIGENTMTGLLAVVGGSRTLFLDVTQSNFGGDSQIRVNPTNPGTLSFNNQSGQNALATITYDNDGMGLGGVDITVGGKFTTFRSLILASDQDLGFRVDITDTGGATAFFSTSVGAGVTQISRDLATFTGAFDVDFTLVDRIMVTLTGPNAQDSTFARLEMVPEPTSAALLGLAAIGLLARRRRLA